MKSNIDLAMADFERALTLTPKLRSGVHRPRPGLAQEGDDDKAMQDFDKAIALDDRSIESRWRGRISRSRGATRTPRLTTLSGWST